MTDHPPGSSQRAKPFPELARAVRSRQRAILARIAGATLDGDRFLTTLAQQLDVEPCAAPARTKFNADSIATLLAAYQRLRQSVLHEAAAELQRDLRAEELAALNERFDALMSQHLVAASEAQTAELVAAAEAQGRYMSFLSHDLRGSLNGIMLMLEVLRRDFVSRGEAAETVGDILLMRRSITDAVTLMERHVQADRLRRGRITPRNMPLDIKPVVSRVVADLSGAAGEKQIVLEMNIPMSASVHADAELFRQALHNLVDNAIRHGGGAVRMEAMREGDEWSIVVADRGPGMDHARLQQWLDPVRRLEMNERGVGLQIAYYAARLMHGRLEGQTAPGHGVTLRLVLPAANP